ncbi:hypothetical protein DITRI_Ditri19aG0120000 [Diplodiscus trichospermus]
MSWNTILHGYAIHAINEDVETCERLFEVMPERNRMLIDGIVHPNDDTLVTVLSAHARDLISWNTIIGGLAMYWRGPDALDLFSQMKNGNMSLFGLPYLEHVEFTKILNLLSLLMNSSLNLSKKVAANFVMLANIHGDLGWWNDMARLKVAIRDIGYKKVYTRSSRALARGVEVKKDVA